MNENGPRLKTPELELDSLQLVTVIVNTLT